MRILVSDDVSEKGVALLREHFDVDVKTNMPTEELLACIGEYDGLVTRSQTQVTKEVIDAAKNLKVIGRAGVGVDNIDIPAATARGIVVLNAPEGNTIAATEHTVAMMMAMTRHIPQAHASIVLTAFRCRAKRSALSALDVSAAALPCACRPWK